MDELAKPLHEPPTLIAEALRARDSRWTRSLESPVVDEPAIL